MSYTPGPWKMRAYKRGDAGFYVEAQTTRDHLADVFSKPDALAIAALPTLMDAVSAYLAEREELGLTADSRTVSNMRAAIAKATGADK